MIGIRRAEERYRSSHPGLESYYTFSFGDYQDPMHQGYGPLKVINLDCLEPGQGFPTHPHAEVEILSWVVQGELEYKDDLGHEMRLSRGDAQVACAGTGIEHSVHNASPDTSLLVYQFHLVPASPESAPSLDHWEDPRGARGGHWCLIASHQGEHGAMALSQPCDVHVTALSRGEEREYYLQPGHHAWLQFTSGTGWLNGKPVKRGDGVAIHDEDWLNLQGGEDLEVLLFDLA